VHVQVVGLIATGQRFERPVTREALGEHRPCQQGERRSAEARAAGGGTCPSSWAAGPGIPLGVDELSEAELLDWSRGCRRDVGAVGKGGELTGPNPTDRGKAGSKYHILGDANGLPLNAMLSAANTHDSNLFEPLLETNPGVRGRRGRPGPPGAVPRSCTPRL
jgi:DDE family transposase